MANTIQGKNIILYMLDSAVYYPVLCGQSMDFTLDQEALEVTSINSTSAREYIVGMSTSRCNITGITTLDNSNSRISLLYILQLAIRRQAQEFKITFLDDNGDAINITFSGIFITTGFNRERGTYSKSSVNILVSGDIAISEVVTPPVPSELQEIYLDLAEGATSVSNAVLDNVEIFLVEREGLSYDEVSGTPTGRQFRYNDATNSIIFDAAMPGNPAAPNLESIHILYKPN